MHQSCQPQQVLDAPCRALPANYVIAIEVCSGAAAGASPFLDQSCRSVEAADTDGTRCIPGQASPEPAPET